MCTETMVIDQIQNQNHLMQPYQSKTPDVVFSLMTLVSDQRLSASKQCSGLCWWRHRPQSAAANSHQNSGTHQIEVGRKKSIDNICWAVNF